VRWLQKAGISSIAALSCSQFSIVASTVHSGFHGRCIASRLFDFAGNHVWDTIESSTHSAAIRRRRSSEFCKACQAAQSKALDRVCCARICNPVDVDSILDHVYVDLNSIARSIFCIQHWFSLILLAMPFRRRER